jgi:hypothetical protein
MPRIRSLKPELWDDEAIGEASHSARLLFLGLITQADDEGRQRADARLLRARIFPYDDELTTADIDAWLFELAVLSLVVIYEANGTRYASLTGWDNQKIDHPKPSRLPSPDAGQIVDFEGGPDSSRTFANDREASRMDQGSRIKDQGEDRGVGETIADAPLSMILAELIEANTGRKQRVGKRWAEAERLMIERDGRDPVQAEALIRWCQADEFWRGNVLSMAKFREKYDQLVLHSQRGGKQLPKPPAPVPTFAGADTSEAERLWQTARDALAPSIPPSSLEALDSVKPLGVRNGVLHLSASERQVGWLEQRYRPRIEAATGCELEVAEVAA